MRIYITENKEVYDKLRQILSGIAFFRNTNKEYFIKTTKNPVIENFLELGLIKEYVEVN